MIKINSQKGAIEISTFAGMAIIAAVVVVASTIAVIKYRGMPSVTAPVAVITPKVTPNATPIIDETANWQLYKTEYGYEIKYPQSKINVISYSKVYNEKEQDFLFMIQGETSSEEGLSVEKNATDSVSDYFKRNQPPTSEIENNDKTIIWQCFYSTMPIGFKTKNCLGQNGNDVYRMSFLETPDKKLYLEKDFDNILKNFRITN
ncbi:MAG: hypothetical protein V1732_06115 [Patescibacteria group bacterium]